MELISGPSTNVLLYGGGRAAKSFGIIYAMHVRALGIKSRHGVFRLKRSQTKGALFLDTFPKVVRLATPGFFKNLKVNINDMTVTYPNGSEFRFGGLEDYSGAEAQLGYEYSDIFIDEASQVPYISYTKLLTRLAERNNLVKKFLVAENPTYNKQHWVYRLFIENKQPMSEETVDSNDFVSLQMNPIDNLDNIDPLYIDMYKNMPEREKRRFLYGEFGDGVDNGVYDDWISKANSEARIGTVVPSAEAPIYAVFDIGWRDATAIWVVQFVHNKVLMLEYYQNTHKTLDFYLLYLWNRGYFLRGIYLPWDAKSKNMSSGLNIYNIACNISRAQNMLKGGHPFFVKVLPVIKVFDGINAARTMFDICYFDKIKCKLGIEHLRNYHYDIDDKVGMFKPNPEEDGSVHCADAFRYTACAYYQLAPTQKEKGRDSRFIYVDEIMKANMPDTMYNEMEY
jgi:phage terminase large subunit